MGNDEKMYQIRDGLEGVDWARVHQWLNTSYWTPGIARERIEHAARHSAMVVSAFSVGGTQTGFLRVVSDKARFAYLCDVWVDTPPTVARASPGGWYAMR